MLFKSFAQWLLLPVAIRIALAQNSTSSGACNNSPNLCNRAYDDVTYLGAHDSPFVRTASNDYDTSGNQFYSSTAQLSAGVRLLTAQVQTNDGGALHVCHTSCDLFDAGTLSNWLAEVRSWMESNPHEVVTILLVNGASASASDLASQYQKAGITTDLAYTPTGATAGSQQWPTLQSMINSGRRLVNFVDYISGNSAAPYLISEFTYIFENNYDVATPSNFTCDASRPTIATSQALSNGMMPFMNHFLYSDVGFGIQAPNDTYIQTINAPSGGTGNLGAAATECTQVYGRAPSFILVDFFNVGPAIATVDRLNGVSNPVGRTSVSRAVMENGATSYEMRGSYLLAVCLAVLVSSML